MKLSLDQAESYEMPFGKYRGQTLAQIAGEGRSGLKYLDWLRGQDFVRETLKDMIDVVLSEPNNERELERALED